MHYSEENILIQSLELPRELPVRPSAEQVAKLPDPCNHCRGQVTQPNVTNSPVFLNFLHFPEFH
jgi:hypothetical protein